MSNVPSNQSNNGQSNQQNNQQFNNIQRFMNPQQVFMQYQHHLNSYGMSSQVNQGYPITMDHSQYYVPKIGPNIAHPQAQPTPFQQSQFNMNSNPLQHHLYLSPRNNNYVHYENTPYKMQYRTQSEPIAPVHTYPSNIKKQDINIDRDINMSHMMVGYDYRNNVNFKQGMTDRNLDMHRYQYDQVASQGSNIPFDMLSNIERGVYAEISKLRECISEDCKNVFGDLQKLQTQFPVYNSDGSNLYSIKDILAYLLPYHLYNFDLSSTNIQIANLKAEVMESDTKFIDTSSKEISELRIKLEKLSNSEDLTNKWRCYKSIMKTISNQNNKLNEPNQSTIGRNDHINNNANVQSSMSYAQCMNYIQYTGGSGQPHNSNNNTNNNNNNYWA